jgi:MFS family permease
VINAPPPTIATLPLTLLIQAAASAATIAPAVAAPALLLRLNVGAVGVGIYIALVYLAAMVSSQWGAALVKRWGPIRSSQVCLAFAALGLMLVALPHTGAAGLGALLIGAGYGPITPASSEILARTTPPERYALVFSIKQTGVPVGGALAGLLVPSVLGLAGPVWALALIAALCVLGALLAQALRGELDGLRDPAAPLPTLARLTQPMRFVASHAVLRTLALCSLVFSAVQVCVSSYLVSFLTHDLRWTLVAAGAALAVAQVAGVAGRVLWGVLADRRGEARSTLLGLAVAMALCGLAMPWLRPATPQVAVIALLIAYGATAIGWNGVFLATIARVVPLEQAALATSGCLFFTYFGVVIGPPLFGAAGTALGTLGPPYALLALPLAWALWKLSRWESRRA